MALKGRADRARPSRTPKFIVKGFRAVEVFTLVFKESRPFSNDWSRTPLPAVWEDQGAADDQRTQGDDDPTSRDEGGGPAESQAQPDSDEEFEDPARAAGRAPSAARVESPSPD